MQAWRFDKGSIEGIDVTGRIIAAVGHILGNILEGNIRLAVYVDDDVSDEQQQALLDDCRHDAADGAPIARHG